MVHLGLGSCEVGLLSYSVPRMWLRAILWDVSRHFLKQTSGWWSRVSGWLAGCMDEWMDGWVDGWVDEWMDGRTEDTCTKVLKHFMGWYHNPSSLNPHCY